MFGHEFRKKHFPHVSKDIVPVNHGSYGLPPKVVLDKHHSAVEMDNAGPDRYVREKQPLEYVAALQAVAPMLQTDWSNLALVANATTAINTVLRLYPFSKGDTLAMASTAYGACANTIRFVAQQQGLNVEVVSLQYPLSDDQVVAEWAQLFAAKKVRLAMFDTVSSMPGVQVPWRRLVALCREHSVLSLVDGAHGVGLIDMHLSEAPDFLASNLHKWCFVPRGCAVLYVAPEHHSVIQSLPISHSYSHPTASLPPLVSKFFFIGSQSFAAVSCVPAAIEFRKLVGGEEAIRAYCFGLARQAAAIAHRRWPGSVLENSEGTLATAMVSFTLPMHEYGEFHYTLREIAALVEFAAKHQMQHRTFVPVAGHGKSVVGRFSAQVYNELSDFEYAASALDAALRAFFSQT